MPIWGWVCVSLVAVVFLYSAAEMIRNSLNSAKVARDGATVVAHVVAADDRLYQPLGPGVYPDYSSVKVVFTLDDTLSDAHYTKLEAYADRLRNYTPADSSKVERTLASVKKPHIPCPRPLRLPDRLTNGEEVYAASVDAYWNLLPEGRLTRPYIHCKVLVGPGGGVRMVQSPPTDWVPPPAGPGGARPGAEAGTPGRSSAAVEAVVGPASSRVDLIDAARSMYAEKYSRKYARRKLLAAGHPDVEVDSVVEEAWRTHVGQMRVGGFVSLGVGAMMLVAGAGITIAGMQAAEAQGGGRFYVMTGLIVCGFIGIGRGLVRLASTL